MRRGRGARETPATTLFQPLTTNRQPPAVSHRSSVISHSQDQGPMRWSNVWTIFRREVHDQARDRRTLFMVFALPILLYPMLGIGLAQLQAMREEKPRLVVVV